MDKLVHNVGVNDADYVVATNDIVVCADGKQKRKAAWRCPFWVTWRNMLSRCFNEKWKVRHPTYKDITCCDEWLTFSNFKRWMETQDWEGKQLDKDIIFPNNKVYSPETCAFVSRVTNSFVISSETRLGEWPLGVNRYEREKPYLAKCRNPFTKKREHLGGFSTSEEAHEAWRKRKHELAQLVAELETDPRVVEALKKRYSVEEWYPSDVKY